MFGFFRRAEPNEVSYRQIVSLGGEVMGVTTLVSVVASQLDVNEKREVVSALQQYLGEGMKLHKPEWLDERYVQIYRDGIARIILEFLKVHEPPQSN
jgi:hypothetical protein